MRRPCHYCAKSIDFAGDLKGIPARSEETDMAKGQMKSNKEAKKPKKDKIKTIAAAPSQKGVGNLQSEFGSGKKK